MSSPDSIGQQTQERVAAAIEQSGRSIANVADAAKLNHETLRRRIRNAPVGLNVLRVDEVHKLSAALGVDFNDLLGGAA